MRFVDVEQGWPDSWKTSHAYDLLEIWDQRHQDLGYAYAYERRRDSAIQAVKLVTAPGARVLDVAAAQGNFSLALAEAGYRVTWNDLREELADYVRLKYEYGDIEFVSGDVFGLDLEGQFDTIVVTEIIEHVAHPDEFLRRVAALVKPGGYVVMTTPNGGYFRNRLPKFSDCPDPSIFEDVQFQPNADGHIFLLHEHEVRKFADQAGLVVTDLRLFTNPLTNGHMKLGGALKILPRSAVIAVERITASWKGRVARRLNVHMLAVMRRVF